MVKKTDTVNSTKKTKTLMDGEKRSNVRSKSPTKLKKDTSGRYIDINEAVLKVFHDKIDKIGRIPSTHFELTSAIWKLIDKGKCTGRVIPKAAWDPDLATSLHIENDVHMFDTSTGLESIHSLIKRCYSS